MKSKKTFISGIKTHYVETDCAGKEPLIILHGWGSSTESWKEAAKNLELARRRVLIPDLPGFGKTEEPPRPWGIEDYIIFIKKFLKKLDIEKFYLAGHSFGGQIAISMAVKNGGAIRALMLLAPARIEKRRGLKVNLFLVIATIGKLIFSLPILKPLKGVVQKIQYKIVREKDYYLASPLMKKTFKMVVGEKAGEKLSSVKVPTLVMWGDKDLVTPLKDAHIIKNQVKNSKLHIFKNSGHGINLERPKELADLMLEFENSLSNKQ